MAQAKGQVTTEKKVKKGLFTKLGFLSLASFMIAAMLTWVVALSIEELPILKGAIGRNNYSDVLFMVFLVGFIVSISASAYAFISKEELSGEVHVKRFEQQEKNLWKEALQPKKLTPEQEAALRRQQARRALEEEREAEIVDDFDAVLAASEELEEMEEDEPVSEPEPVGGKLSVQGEKQRATVMNFLSRGLQEVQQTRPKLDSFNKFGVNLYIAGACEAMGSTENLSDDEVEQIMVDSVGAVGTKSEQAKKFAAEFSSYLGNPKYLNMIEAGREAMNLQISGDGNAAKKLETALDSWNTKGGEGGGATGTSSGTVAVLFTDIVGSTAMTQNHGDAAAQEVVRTHNRIVRAALTTYHGKEVKHTGDGIMASFSNVANSVGASIYIQRKVAESNATNPAVPLGVKIGINAGEPIVEEDDLFGTTVQLSARIVDKATNYQILVSETVKGICAGKAYKFVNRGTREMKGFEDPIALFEAVWQEDGQAAA